MFESRVVQPTLEGTHPQSYEQLVKRFGFESPSQASNALLTTKRRFKRAVEAVVQEYAPGPHETAEELESLKEILAG